MKSQVSALLHVVSGILKDASIMYPALKETFLKDFERIALNCRSRGITFFTLDLPALESVLLNGLETGRLDLNGPVSHRVSNRIMVPRLFSGLWLRVFYKSACLKQDVDTTSLLLLRQLLTVGKGIEMDCSSSRVTATVKAYHDVERLLREPSLGWASDRITDDESGGGPGSFYGAKPPTDDQYCYLSSSDRSGCDILLSSLPKEALRAYHFRQASICEVNIPGLSELHLVQAADRSDVWNVDLPLFKDQSYVSNHRKEDIDILNKVQQVADLVVGSMDRLDPLLYSEALEASGSGTGFRHGPGAVAEGRKQWEKSHYMWWPLKLEGVFPFHACGVTSAHMDRDKPVNHELASRLIAVPKTCKGPRLIAAEPVAHQWCQQLVLRFFFDQCLMTFGKSFIDFRDQSKSGEMVLQASLTGELATVDLSDASDRLTCWTVERIFRSNPSILSALHAARTRYIKDGISDVPSFLRLKKFATQGTATTFPVMSLTMLFIALGACLDQEEVTWTNIWKLRDQVRVFGDDIIMPKRGYMRLTRAMDLLQLKVNMTKSYIAGSFRESCGVDGAYGDNVTPVQPTTLIANSPASNQSLIDTSNNFFVKGLWHAAEAVLSLIDRRVLSDLPVSQVGSAGFRGLASFTGSSANHLNLRWNDKLHRIEARTWTIFSKPANKPRDDFAAVLDFMSRKQCSRAARVVSVYAESRSTKSRRHWEPISEESLITLKQHHSWDRVLSRIPPMAKEHLNGYQTRFRHRLRHLAEGERSLPKDFKNLRFRSSRLSARVS